MHLSQLHLLFLVKLSEKLSRHQEAAKYLQQLLNQMTSTSSHSTQSHPSNNTNSTMEIFTLFAVIYKNLLTGPRNAWRRLQQLNIPTTDGNGESNSSGNNNSSNIGSNTGNIGNNPSSIDSNTSNNPSNAALVEQYRCQLEQELRNICQEAIDTLESAMQRLFSNNSNDGQQDNSSVDASKGGDQVIRVFIQKTQGDYHRYLAEVEQYHAMRQCKVQLNNTGDIQGNSQSNGKSHSADDSGNAASQSMTSMLLTPATQAALKAYQQAMQSAQSLPWTNLVKLGLGLNYSVFYYDCLGDRDGASRIALETFLMASRELQEFTSVTNVNGNTGDSNACASGNGNTGDSSISCATSSNDDAQQQQRQSVSNANGQQYLNQDTYEDINRVLQLLKDNMTLWTMIAEEEERIRLSQDSSHAVGNGVTSNTAEKSEMVQRME